MKAFGKEGDLCVNLFMARDDDDDVQGERFDTFLWSFHSQTG